MGWKKASEKFNPAFLNGETKNGGRPSKIRQIKAEEFAKRVQLEEL